MATKLFLRGDGRPNLLSLAREVFLKYWAVVPSLARCLMIPAEGSSFTNAYYCKKHDNSYAKGLVQSRIDSLKPLALC